MNDRLGFLKKTKPFKKLKERQLTQLAEALEEVNFSKTEIIYQQHKTKLSGLDIIIEGSYEAFFYTSGGQRAMVEELTAGKTYGAFSILLNKGRSINTVSVKKGTKIHRIPIPVFKKLCKKNAEFYNYFLTHFGKEMLNDQFSHHVIHQSLDMELLTFDRYFTRRLDSVRINSVISCAPDTKASDAANLMESEKLSCLFIKDKGQYIGYITDIILRNKIIGARQSVDLPVSSFMEGPIYYINKSEYVYEAILMMFKNKIRYLLVMEDDEKIGVISRNKLLSDQAQSPFVFIQSVRHADTTDELKDKWQQVPEVVYNLLSRGVKSELVNQIITNISDTIAQKVIDGVIEKVGEPPAKFVFMTLGSEGRKELTLKTDQDNAIIYEDKANQFRDKTRKYFLKFADMVSSELNYIGFTFCSGGLMAKNPKWTHSLSHWMKNYDRWIDNPNAESVMNVSTFFDCRLIYGAKELIHALQAHILKKLADTRGYFYAQLAQNALQYEPPLTFFRGIKTITKDNQQVFNIKHAMTPIVDLVRVYALKNSIIKTNTGERLHELLDKNVFTKEDHEELMQSYYYLMGLRLKSQAHYIIYDHKPPDNFVQPGNLSKIEIVTLIEIFKVINNFQQRIKMVFTRNMFA